jgi:membrane fusion protein (multidrug efflux system)
VQEGATLVEIDPEDYNVALAKAQANLETAQAAARALNIDVPISTVDTDSQLKFTSSDIENAKAAIAAGEKQVAAAQARILEAEAENVKAQDDVQRYHLLLTKDELPKQIYDHAIATAQTDTAAVVAAKAEEASAEQNVAQARSRLLEAIARDESAHAGPQRVASTRARALSAVADERQKKAELDQAELNLGYTRVLAPVTGEVTKKVVVGLNVDPGEQLLTVVPLDQVWITANFKETQLKHMRPAQKVEITCDSNDRTYKGHVDSIAGATGPIFSLLPPENATGNYVKIVQRVPVKIVLEQGENRDHQLRPGMNVEAKVYLR